MAYYIAKIGPTIIFIILPIIYLLFIGINYSLNQINVESITGSNIFLLFIFLVYLIYIINSAIVPFGKHITKFRYDYGVIGFDYLSKIVKVTFVFLIIMLFIFYFIYTSAIASYEKQLQTTLSKIGIKSNDLQTSYYTLEYFNFGALTRQEYSPIFDITAMLFLLVFTGIFKLAIQFRKRNFRFNYTIGCFMISSNSKDDVQKIQYIMKGLNSYNYYIQKKLKVTMEKLKEIYFYLSITNSNQLNEIIRLSLKSLENKNSLHLLHTIISLPNVKSEEFLKPFSRLRYWQNIIEQWKAVIAGTISFLVAVVPTIISTLQFFFPKSFIGS